MGTMTMKFVEIHIVEHVKNVHLIMDVYLRFDIFTYIIYDITRCFDSATQLVTPAGAECGLSNEFCT